MYPVLMQHGICGNKSLSVMEEYIPKATISQQRNLPWVIKAKIRKRNSVYRKARTTSHSLLWSKYATLRNEVVQLLRQSKKNHLKRMSNLGSKQFWKTIKYLNKTSSQIPTLKDGATEAVSNVDKASLLNELFSKNFNDSIPPLSELDHQCFLADSSLPPTEGSLCIEQEVFNLLNTLDTNKASGPNGISGKMLKSTAISITPILTELFNLSITSGKIPSNWKLSSVNCPHGGEEKMVFSIFTVTLPHAAAGGAARSSGPILSDCQEETRCTVCYSSYLTL